MVRRLTIPERVWVTNEIARTGNKREVLRNWPFQTPRPSRSSLIRVTQKYETNGTVQNLNKSGRPRSVLTPLNIGIVQQVYLGAPKNSVRRTSAELGIGKTSVFKMLKSLNMKAYLPTLVQGLKVDDFVKRFDFSTEMLALWDENYGLIDRTWFSDESTFNLNGVVNRHNSYYWAEENPHYQIEQQQKSIGLSVWAAVSSQGLIGPYFFHSAPPSGVFPHFAPCNVNAVNYLDLLQNYFYPRFEDLPDMEDHLFMQDGAPPHYANIVRSWLNQTLPNQWIGRGNSLDNCKVIWPPRSPDLTPCDFFLWGFVKHRVYARNPTNLFELQSYIIDAFQEVTPEMCERVCRSVYGRLKTCLDLGGAQVARNMYPDTE